MVALVETKEKDCFCQFFFAASISPGGTSTVIVASHNGEEATREWTMLHADLARSAQFATPLNITHCRLRAA